MKTAAEKEMRRIAKSYGLTFKTQNLRINGAQAYRFTSRKTGENVIENCTFWSAYECCMDGSVQNQSEIS